jgi:HAD superfamily hydrolase (TIGR01509 family)
VYEVSKEIQGLIFDFDGTIVDSMPSHLLSWKAAFSAFGRTFSERFFYDHAGFSLIGVVEAYNNEMGTALVPSAVVAAKDENHLAYLDQTKPIPQVLDIVRHYHGRLPMAVATGNSRRLTVPLMDTLKLAKYFKVVVFGEDVVKGKPDPECFLKAAHAMGVPQERCEVFEDGDPGIEGARRAFMKVTDIRPWLC